jgi:hypothetical protein
MIIDTIEGCEIRLEDGPEGEKVTFTADGDIVADGANGQKGARAAYMADAYSFIAPPGRMFCSRLNVSRG